MGDWFDIVYVGAGEVVFRPISVSFVKMKISFKNNDFVVKYKYKNNDFDVNMQNKNNDSARNQEYKNDDHSDNQERSRT